EAAAGQHDRLSTQLTGRPVAITDTHAADPAVGVGDELGRLGLVEDLRAFRRLDAGGERIDDRLAAADRDEVSGGGRRRLARYLDELHARLAQQGDRGRRLLGEDAAGFGVGAPSGDLGHECAERRIEPAFGVDAEHRPRPAARTAAVVARGALEHGDAWRLAAI